MIQDRLHDKDKDIKGVQKQASELLACAWEKGYVAGFNDGYATRREADKSRGKVVPDNLQGWRYEE